MQTAPYCWLHVLVLKKSENHYQKIKIHNNVIKKTKEGRGSNKKLSVTLDHHQKLVFDECLRSFQMGSQQIEFNHKYIFKKTSTTYKSHSINKKKNYKQVCPLNYLIPRRSSEVDWRRQIICYGSSV